MLSLFILWCAVVLEVALFVLARFAVAFGAGVRGRAGRLGLDLDAWRGASTRARVLFTVAGPCGCYLAAAACFTLSLAIGGEVHFDAQSMRVDVDPGGPAAVAGVEDGDLVVSVDGESVADWDTLRGQIGAREGRRVVLGVERGGRRIEVRPAVGADGKIRVGPFTERRPVGLGHAVGSGLVRPLETIAGAVRTVLAGVTREEVTGPVGIVRAVSATSRRPDPVPMALGMAGALVAYFLFIPGIAAVLLYPRRREEREGQDGQDGQDGQEGREGG